MPRLISAQEFIEDELKQEIKDMNNPGCINCNECCSVTAMITKKEYNALKNYLTKTPKGKQLFTQYIASFKKQRQQKTLNMMCPFSNTGKRCTIYKDRPQICRDFHCSTDLRAKDYTKDRDKAPYVIFDLFKKELKQ